VIEILPIQTENSTENFGPPLGREGDIGNLPYCWSTEHGYKEVISVWELSDAEREAIANGCNVRLGVGWLGGFPPVTLGVTHEKKLPEQNFDERIARLHE
jgi:hypothetical protein